MYKEQSVKQAQKIEAEDSIRLRILTSLMSLVGIFAASQIADTPIWIAVASIVGVVCGSWLSYERRNKKNTLTKIWISVGILLVAGAFFRELLIRVNMSVSDTRIPLTNMLIGLQSLHCFDLPRRRDLSLSSLVGLTLLASAATLSRDISFSAYVFVFLALSAYMFESDCVSRTLSRAKAYTKLNPVFKSGSKKSTINSFYLGKAAFLALVFISLCLATFAVLPKYEFQALRNIRLAAGLNLSFLGKNSAFTENNRLISADGSIKSHPKAYCGFAEELDTNYRGQLGDNIVMHVSSAKGEYWRGMAYDTFNGISWYMSKPKKVFERNAESEQLIQLSPVPSLAYADSVRKRELIQVFYVEEDASNLVVGASVPSRIYFPSNKLQLDTYGAIRSPVGIQKDMVYTIISFLPIFDITKLRKMPEPDPEDMANVRLRLKNYLQLPHRLDPEVYKLATSIAGKGNSFQKAERISRYIQGNYRYDLNVPPTPQGMDSVSDLLFHKKRGFCETFASAFVIMCRSQGIPARLITGYLPGEYNPFTGLWDIRLHDAHCWAEILIPHYGWVPFDATPAGIPLGSNGVDQSSAIDYFGSRIESLSKWLWTSPQGQKLRELALFVLAWLGNCLSLAYKIWPWLTAAAVICGCILSFKALKKQFSMHFWPFKSYNKFGTVLSDQSGAASQASISASKSFQKLLKELSILDIRRSLDDTSSDLLKKARKKLLSTEEKDSVASAKDFLDNLDKFLEKYDEARFGNQAVSLELEQYLNDICRRTKNLSKNKIVRSISKKNF